MYNIKCVGKMLGGDAVIKMSKRRPTATTDEGAALVTYALLLLLIFLVLSPWLHDLFVNSAQESYEKRLNSVNFLDKQPLCPGPNCL